MANIVAVAGGSGTGCGDIPSDISNCSNSNCAEDDKYLDWLAEVESRGGEFAWIRQHRNFTTSNRTVSAINRLVLESNAVREAVNREAARHNNGGGSSSSNETTRKSVDAKARRILSEMEHNFQLATVRPVGYAVLKVLKQIFDGIFVNSTRLDQLKRLSDSGDGSRPIVFMPTHKSYLDFLLISLFCYHHEIRLPAICAGEDFRVSHLLGELLRRCGAFFIRRSFNNDNLYWAIFSAYVQAHLLNDVRPIEFFVEGRRSRTTKSLPPKNGLFRVVLEPFFTSNLFDVIIAPVTINYDKHVEETLYSRELLGIPKPKETASGLFKAREILGKRFGNIFLTFGRPISVREYVARNCASVTAFRAELAFSPNSLNDSAESRLREEIRTLSHRIVRVHNTNNILTVWPLICFISSTALTMAELVGRVEALIRLFSRLRLCVSLVKGSAADDIRYYLELHKNLLDVDEARILRRCATGSAQLGEQQRTTIDCLAYEMAVFNYSNLAHSSVVHVGLVAVPLLRGAPEPVAINRLFDDFQFLQQLFQREFIYVPGEQRRHFDETLCTLRAANIAGQKQHTDEVTVIDAESLEIVANMLQCWINAYFLLLRLIFELVHQNNSDVVAVDVAELISFCRNRLAALNDDTPNFGLKIVCFSDEAVKNCVNLVTISSNPAENGSNLNGNRDIGGRRTTRVNVENLATIVARLAKFLSPKAADDRVLANLLHNPATRLFTTNKSNI